MEGELKARLHRMLTTKVGWLLNDIHHPFQLLFSCSACLFMASIELMLQESLFHQRKQKILPWFSIHKGYVFKFQPSS